MKNVFFFINLISLKEESEEEEEEALNKEYGVFFYSSLGKKSAREFR